MGWVVGTLLLGIPLVYHAINTPTTGLNTLEDVAPSKAPEKPKDSTDK
jgi:hypothetical protein